VKRRALQTDTQALSASADDFADQAEKLQKLPLLAKANSNTKFMLLTLSNVVHRRKKVVESLEKGS